MFPQVDPIPLPAPVWIFYVLLLVTAALHFVAVQMLLGGTALAVAWSFGSRISSRPAMREGADLLAGQLPILMTFVINLGVPPLLFTQVLYGRALYTSSVLIGVVWLSVIALLMAGYSCLYIMSNRAARQKRWGWFALIALLIFWKIAFIYSTNMTLMLRPEVWGEMYRHSPLGVQFNSGDPTVLPRWTFMVVGGFAATGASLLLLSLGRSLRTETAVFLRRSGGCLTASAVLAQAAAAFWVVRTQPEAIARELEENPLFTVPAVAWLAVAGLVFLLGLAAYFRAAKSGWVLPCLIGLLVVVKVGAAVVARSTIRNESLLHFGYDMWDRAVAVNWVVVGAFLAIFVLALGTVGWLIYVASQSTGEQKSYV